MAGVDSNAALTVALIASVRKVDESFISNPLLCANRILVIGTNTPVCGVPKGARLRLLSARVNLPGDAIWQAFAVLLPVRTVGVMGDARTYDNVCG